MHYCLQFLPGIGIQQPNYHDVYYLNLCKPNVHVIAVIYVGLVLSVTVWYIQIILEAGASVDAQLC